MPADPQQVISALQLLLGGMTPPQRSKLLREAFLDLEVWITPSKIHDLIYELSVLADNEIKKAQALVAVSDKEWGVAGVGLELAHAHILGIMSLTDQTPHEAEKEPPHA